MTLTGVVLVVMWGKLVEAVESHLPIRYTPRRQTETSHSAPSNQVLTTQDLELISSHQVHQPVNCPLKMPLIPARSFASQLLRAGQSIKVVNTGGGQVIDTWAMTLEPSPFPKFMSMVHTRSSNPHKLLPGINDSFRDNRRVPILTITEDTSPGIHDVLYAACSPERYAQLDAPKGHGSCANNLYTAVKAREEPVFEKVLEFLEYGWMPDPLNLFMHVEISDGKIPVLSPTSQPGDYIVLKAEQDCVVFMSACPMDLNACNRGEPESAEFEVL